MHQLTIATTASGNPMGAQRYEAEVVAGAQAVLPGWRVGHQTARSLRSPLEGTIRLPMGWLANASVTQRAMVGRFAYGRRPGVLHRMDLVLPPAPGPNVVTIHDTVAWRFDDESAPITAAAEEARRADAVICVSAFTANEVQRFLGVADPVVVHNGVDNKFFEAAPLDDARRRELGLTGPYVLHAGGVSKRKNLEALALAWPTISQAHPGLTLALAGPENPRRNELFGGLSAVRLLGRVPDAVVPQLVAGAAVVVVPSTYEGFGLPALEAMAAGVPVVAADSSALPEVVGDAGWLVEPTAAGLIDGINDVLAGDRDTAELLARGRERARSFTWQACLDGHARVWKSVVRRPAASTPG